MATVYKYKIQTQCGVVSGTVFANSDQEAIEKARQTTSGRRAGSTVIEVKKA